MQTQNKPQIFLGVATTASAKVYVEFPSSSEDVQLVGYIEGPLCEHARTLPARYPLNNLPPGRTVLAEAVVPDPCFWSMETPFIYRAHVQHICDRSVTLDNVYEFGLRRLAIVGKDFVFNTKRWVVRSGYSKSLQRVEKWNESLDCAESLTTELLSWREAATAIRMKNPTRDILAAAQRLGTMIVAEITIDTLNELYRLSEVGDSSAVVFAVLDTSVEEAIIESTKSRGLILAQRGSIRDKLANWADVLLCDSVALEVDLQESSNALSETQVPIVASRPAENTPKDAENVRNVCDLLQRDLALRGDCAGYLV